MKVSAREREHFDRIREAMSIERSARTREDLQKTAIERIAEGLALGEALPRSKERDALDLDRALGQAQFYERARRLGLYRP